MTWELFVAVVASCLALQQPLASCVSPAPLAPVPVKPAAPQQTGEAVEVALSAPAALLWDVTTGQTLYQRNATVRRPVASLTKLLSALAVRQSISTDAIVTIPAAVLAVQRQGADIILPVGGQASVHDLLAASLIASANDAMVTLAVAAKNSEAAFVEFANSYAQQLGLPDTKAGNATGLSGGEQYSTASDIKKLITRAYTDPVLGPLLAQPRGVLQLASGQRRAYVSTNKLSGTYVPILAAKTGYTAEAGGNLVIITEQRGRKLGAVILGSSNRFQDMKILVEWVNRNYTW